MAAEVLRNKKGTKVGSIDTDARGKKTIRDAHGRKIGSIEADSKGVETLRDGSGRKLASYDPKTDKTKDHMGRPVGKGNSLLSFLPLDDLR